METVAIVLKILSWLGMPLAWMWHRAKIWRGRRRAAKARMNMMVDHSAYYDVEDGVKVDGPFCPTCFDTQCRKIRFIRADKPAGQDGHSWEFVQCSQCKLAFRECHIGEYLRTQPPRQLA